MLPAISVVIPTYNGGAWIRQALESALSQPVSLEIVVSDDNSQDDTVDVVRDVAATDPRVRLIDGPCQGAAANTNHAVRSSTAPLVKFLYQDDVLAPDSLPMLLELLHDPAVGMAFGTRDVIYDRAIAAAAEEWDRHYGRPWEVLDLVPGRNDGPAIVARYLEICRTGTFGKNWAGEPSSVMARRSVLERVGLLNTSLRQMFDVDMWVRCAAVADVGFTPERVASFRYHADNLTKKNQADVPWLDPLWHCDALYSVPEIRTRIRPLLHAQQRRTVLWGASRMVRRRFTVRDGREVSRYLRHTFRAATAR